MKANDVAVRPFSDEIILGGTEFVKYNPNGSCSRTLKGSLFILISGKSSFQVNLPHSVFKEYLEVLPLSQGGILLTTNIIMKHPSGHQLA